MHTIKYFLLLTVIACCSCGGWRGWPYLYRVDPVVRDEVQKHIKVVTGRSFETSLQLQNYVDDVLVDSVVDTAFQMMSWYSAHHDTIDLVAHMGVLETNALLVRFVKGMPSPDIYYYKASHEGQRYFRHTKREDLVSQIEVPASRVRLEISETPDTVGKQVVYGVVRLESRDYYDARDSVMQPRSAHFRFYFRSVYRKF